MLEFLINLFLVLIALFILLIGSIQDLKTREVVDWIWVVIAISGCVLHSLQILLLLYNGTSIQNYLFTWLGNVFFAIILALFLSISGLGGEADRIAFVAISFITPILQPIFSITDPKYDIIFTITPKIVGTFFNAYLLAISAPVIIFCYNLIRKIRTGELYGISNASMTKRFALYFIGYPRRTQFILEEIERKPWHFDFLEEYNEESGWKFTFKLRLDTPEDDLKRKMTVAQQTITHDKQSIWVQPSLPFILFILLGFLLELLLGNAIFVITAYFA